jgi:hypothetical protein
MKELAKRRGLKRETLEDAGIERIEGGWLDGWYAVPYYNATGTWKWRYSNPVPGDYPKMRDDLGARFHIYNPLRLGPGEPEVWFAEGEYDTLCLVEAGLPALGIHGAQNVPDTDGEGSDEAPRSSRFDPDWSWLFMGSRVVVMFDNDDEGWKAGRKLAHLLEGEVFDNWDDGSTSGGPYRDINDWWLGDKRGMKNAISRYRWAE